MPLKPHLDEFWLESSWNRRESEKQWFYSEAIIFLAVLYKIDITRQRVASIFSSNSQQESEWMYFPKWPTDYPYCLGRKVIKPLQDPSVKLLTTGLEPPIEKNLSDLLTFDPQLSPKPTGETKDWLVLLKTL